MSCFESCSSFAVDEVGREIFDGVMLERRAILRLSLGALAALSFGWGDSAQAEIDSTADATHAFNTSGELAWGRFIAAVLPMASELVATSRPDEDSYLRRLDSLIGQIETVPRATFEAGMPVSAAYALKSYPVTIMQFRFEPWAAIPCHDHREYNGVLKVIEGDLRVRSFEDLSSVRAPVGDTFRIHETDNRILGPGDRSQLSRTRNNIHYLRAQAQGARVLDLFTYFREDGRSVDIGVNGIDDCRECSAGFYEARWTE